MGSSSLDFFLRDRSCTENLGYLLGQHLPSQSVILLRGELGAGKTTLIQGLGKGLGITDAIASPTFTLVNEYTEGRLPLYHLDLYRLDKEQVGGICPEIYWEGLEVEPGITAIEWSERLPDKPDCYWEINLVHNAKRGRQATINLIGQHDLNLDFLIGLASTTVD